MSVRLRRWFGIPPEIFEKNYVAEMSESDLRLLCYLHWMSDRHSSRRFEVKDRDVIERAGVSARSLSGARKHLIGFGLIAINRELGGLYTYTLCDPATGAPYPGNPKDKIESVKGSGGKVIRAAASQGWVPKSTEDYTVEDEVTENTEFAYGYNTPKTGACEPALYSPFLPR